MIQKRFIGKSSKPALSKDFALKMIEKEAQLDRSCCLDVINELVEIYTEGIEYYSFIRDSKAQHFQEKMQRMFLRNDVMIAIKLKTNQSVLRCETMEERKQEFDLKRCESAAKAQEVMNNTKTHEKELNRVIDYSKLRNIETARKAAMDFKAQDEDLNKRLASRKKSMLTKSMESFRYLNISQSTSLSTVKEEVQDPLGVTFVNLITEEEEETDIDSLERIMEKFCQEKALKSSQIQVKYENQINLLEEEGSLFDQLRAQLKKDMQSELLTLTNEIESRKAEEIHLLKHRHRKNSISYS
jgi:hypothetical protein